MKRTSVVPFIVLSFAAQVTLIAISVLPTWWITATISLFRLFPKSHPWRNSMPTFPQWVMKATLLNVLCGLNFWFAGGMLVFVIQKFYY